MQEKHPKLKEPIDLSLLENPPDCIHLLSEQDIKEAIFSFPKGLAPGPTQLRPQHLVDALKSALRFDFLLQITAVCNLLEQGIAPTILSTH